MNFIFDIGNVLVDFKPEDFLSGFIDSESDRDRINDIIFKSSEWIELDRGTMTAKEARDRFCKVAPEYSALIDETMDRIPEMFTAMEETVALLPRIKKAGHGLYYLSNFHDTLNQYIREKYAFFNLFDGGIFSCDVHLIKPDPKIYQYLLDKYHLEPSTCLFIDDTKENVEGSIHVGIPSVLFESAATLEAHI